jgi:phosphoribosylamine--glycine ligase
VIEYNARFGDPETQPMMLRLDSDLLPLLADAARGRLGADAAARFGDAAVCVVMASKGYPREYPSGLAIDGLGEVSARSGVKVFHAGTRREGGAWRTAGGRVLGVTARGPDVAAARARAYDAVHAIRFEGAHYRGDVAARALAR